MQEFVEKLLTLNDVPVVTITVALDPRFPGNDADRIRVRNLMSEAKDRVSAMGDRSQARQILRKLDELAADIDLSGGAHGLVVVATATYGETRLVPFPVQDGVSIGRTPTTRYLVQGLRRSPRYRILVISDRATRLFDASRDVAVEIFDGFPMAASIVPRDRRATNGRFALPPGRDDKELWRNFYRDVDAALTKASRGDELPIVLVGVRHSLQMFLEVSAHRRHVVGEVEGAHDQLSANALATLVWPRMRDELKRERARAIEELSNAVATGAAVTGIDEVWKLGRAGRGRLLVVEESYRAEPSVEVDGRLERANAANATGGDATGAHATSPDVISDPVDEIVEHVVRAGGRVEFVADDAIDDVGRIGLLLR